MTSSNDDPNDITRSHIQLSKDTKTGHYRIVEKIGAGGMGEVYLAEDTALNRKVALKFLPTHLCQDADCRARLKREAQAAAKLDHPNIVSVFEVGEFQGRPFFSMQHVEGQSLKDVIAGKMLPIERIIDIGIQICDGLQAAHEKGITHRDIKPSNILIDQDGRAKILDFGLAAIKGTEKLTKTGSTMGTLHYMSPEQTRGEEVDQRSDIFSLGVVLYEMITGKLPFKGDHEPAIIYSIGNEDPEPLARYKSGVPDELQRIVSKTLAKDKTLRYQHADELEADLKGILSKYQTTSPPRVIASRRNRLRIAVLSSIFVVIAGALLILKPWEIIVRPTQEAVTKENRLAIMYFDNFADPADSSRMGEIAANLLITNLSESQYLQVVSSQRLYDILKHIGKEGVKRVDRSVATQVADKARARQMLLGSVLQISPEIILTSQIIDVTTGNVVASQKITGTAGENIFAIIDRLSVEVKQDLSLPLAAINESTPPTAYLTTNSPEAYRYYLEGVDFQNRAYVQEAERRFRRALEFDSTFAMVYFRLSLLSVMKGEMDGAKPLIAKAAEYSDKISRKEKYYIKMQEANIAGNSTLAIEYLQKIVERYPEEKEAFIALGSFYYQDLSKPDEAIRCFNKAIEIDAGLDLPGNQNLDALAYEHLALVYDLQGDFERSIQAIDKSISIKPNEASRFDTRGYVYSRNGRLDQAIASYERALEIKPDFYGSGAPLKLCYLYLFKRDFAQAENCFREFSSNSDKEIRAHARICLAYIPAYQGKFNEALRVLDDGIAADRMEQAEGPSNAEIHLLKALIYEQKDDLTLAMGELETYMEIRRKIDPADQVSGWPMYTRLLAQNGKIEKAEQAAVTLKKIIEEKDTSRMAAYWCALGYIESAKGNPEAALVDFTKATVDVRGFALHYMLAKAYLETGRLGESVSEFEKVLIRYDGERASLPIWAVKAYYLLGLAYEKSGWNQKAIEKYEEFLDIWKNADPGIKEVDNAKVRLARLKATS